MHSHVTGHPPLGELRQALYAVFAGNPLFSPAEQLSHNHAAYDTDEPAALLQQLHVLRHEAARRQRVAALRQQAAQGEPVCLDAVTQLAELEDVLAASRSWRDAQNQRSYRHFMQVFDPTMRVRVLGEAYLGLLERQGFMTGKLN